MFYFTVFLSKKSGENPSCAQRTRLGAGDGVSAIGVFGKSKYVSLVTKTQLKKSHYATSGLVELEHVLFCRCTLLNGDRGYRVFADHLDN